MTVTSDIPAGDASVTIQWKLRYIDQLEYSGNSDTDHGGNAATD